MANEVQLIDAVKYREMLEEEISFNKEHGEEERVHGLEIAVADLMDAPIIEPESLRPKGRWQSVDGTKSCDEWDCTACKQRRTFMDEMELDDMIECYPYCPNCGADLREG